MAALPPVILPSTQHRLLARICWGFHHAARIGHGGLRANTRRLGARSASLHRAFSEDYTLLAYDRPNQNKMGDLMARRYAFLALATVLALGACSHGGSRHFGGDTPGGTPPTGAPPTEEPPPSNPPPPNNPPPSNPPNSADTEGALMRTTNLATTGLGRTLHLGGNVVLGLGERTNPPLDQLGHRVDSLGHALKDDGLAALPVLGGALATTIDGADGRLNGLAQMALANQPLLGATQSGASQAIGVSALSSTPSTGSIVTVGALNQGAQQALNVGVGGTQILGQAGSAAVNVGLLNNTTSGSNPLGAITAPLTNGGGQNPLGAIAAPLTNGGGQNPLGAITAPLTNGGGHNPVGSALNGVTNLLGTR